MSTYKSISIHIKGLSGSGKTTALGAIVDALQEAGFQVSAQDGRDITATGPQPGGFSANITVEEAMPVVQQLAGIRSDVLDAINAEFTYQDAKHGPNRDQSLPGYLMVMRSELNEADDGWNKNLTGRSSALHEITQVVAVGLRCLNDYGTEGSAASTRDRRMA